MDDGTHHRVKMPNWVFTLTGAVAPAATDPALPKGTRMRKRYFRLSTGEERSVPVGNPASPAWTDPFGTAITAYVGLFGSAGEPATWQGATGERRKAI